MDYFGSETPEWRGYGINNILSTTSGNKTYHTSQPDQSLPYYTYSSPVPRPGEYREYHTGENTRARTSLPREFAFRSPHEKVSRVRYSGRQETTNAKNVRSYNEKGSGNYPVSRPQGYTAEVLPRSGAQPVTVTPQPPAGVYLASRPESNWVGTRNLGGNAGVSSAGTNSSYGGSSPGYSPTLLTRPTLQNIQDTSVVSRFAL